MWMYSTFLLLSTNHETMKNKNAYICPKSSLCDTEDIHLFIMLHKYVLLKMMQTGINSAF